MPDDRAEWASAGRGASASANGGWGRRPEKLDSSVLLGQQIGEQPGSREVLPDQQAFDGATVSHLLTRCGFSDC